MHHEEIIEIRRRMLAGRLAADGPLEDPPYLDRRVEGERVIDLSALEPEQWFSALRMMGRSARFAGIATLDEAIRPHVGEHTVGMSYRPVVLPRAVQRAIDEPPRRPVPAFEPAPRRQVNFRLTEDDHRRLVVAAELLGMKPSALARAFCISGTSRALEEA